MASLIVLAGHAGPARAACAALSGPDCTAKAAPDACYPLKGSDTLFDIMTEAIRQARLEGVAGATDLCYFGTGSGNGENQLKAADATHLGAQIIAPMSRNFRPSVTDGPIGTDPGSPDFTARDAAHAGSSGHTAWTPDTANVVGLDAAIFVAHGSSTLGSINFPTFIDRNPCLPYGDPSCQPRYTPTTKAVANNGSLPLDINSGDAFNNLASAVNYTNLMSVVLSGVDGSGTLAACADPRRVRAILDLSQNLGLTGTIQHFIRRDENSGTTDTFKDRIMVVTNTGSVAVRYPWTGGRFCNGPALGSINGATLLPGLCSTARTNCFTDKDCPASESCWYNLNNPDYDPIRRPCMAGDTTVSPTSCTDQITGRPCQASDGNPNCTQGLLVAISDIDKNATDYTTSIGHRVGTGQNLFMGFAGREAANLTYPSKALAINSIKPTEENVIASIYMLARRLFIQNSERSSVVGSFDYPTDDMTNGGVTGGGTAQLNDEKALWTQFLTQRAKMDPIVRQFNFIRCSRSADGGDPGSESNNLCASPASPTPSALGNYAPSSTLSATVSGAKTINSVGRQWNGTALIQVAASAGSQCVSGVVPTGGTVCPDYTGRPTYAPCSQNSDCTSNRCQNVFGHGTNGEAHGLYCAP